MDMFVDITGAPQLLMSQELFRQVADALDSDKGEGREAALDALWDAAPSMDGWNPYADTDESAETEPVRELAAAGAPR